MKQHRLSLALIALATLFAASCTEPQQPQTPYLFIKDMKDTYEFGANGTAVSGTTIYNFKESYAHEDLKCPRLELFSNLDSWKLVPSLEEDLDWVFIWPNEGSGCGRFFLCVDRNLSAQTRISDINVVSGGKVVSTFSIYQRGSTPYLDLDMGGIDSYYAVADGCDLTIRLSTNTLWNVTVDDPDWAPIATRDDNSVTIRVAVNDSDDPRSTAVHFKESGDTELPELVYTITQLGSSEAYSKATEAQISQLQSLYPSGEITDNIWIQGTVISEYASLNVEKHLISYTKKGSATVPVVDNRQMWIQAQDGTPLCVEFVSVSENIYPAGTFLKLHLVGKQAGIDPNTAMYRISGFSAGFVHDAAKAEPVAPAVVSDLSTIGQYENRLVTLKDVQIAMPWGTYLNVDERNCDKVWEYLEDASTRAYAHILIDKHGNHIKLYTSSACPWRHTVLMPQGSGDVTGIVVRRKGLDGEELVLRMQHVEDNQIAKESSTAFAKTVVRFGPFPTAITASQVKADVGVADIKTSVFSRVSSTTSSDAMYMNVWSTIWNTTMSPDTYIFPTPAESNQYHALNSQQWWNGTGTTLTDSTGEAWIITTSTAGWTGQHLLVFAAATWNKGPKEFSLEWSTDESTPVEEWHHLADYLTCSWNANYAAAQMIYTLPAEMNGLEKVVIRHRVTANSTTYDTTSSISTTGTNRMCYWSILELE